MCRGDLCLNDGTDYHSQTIRMKRLGEEDCLPARAKRAAAMRAGRDHDANPGPFFIDLRRQGNSIQVARHIDVGHHRNEIALIFEQLKRLIGTASCARRKADICQHLDNQIAQQVVILNNENAACIWRACVFHDWQIGKI